MSYTREEVEINGLIRPEVLAEIPLTCDCGHPIVFTNTVRQVYCSNPRCVYKVADRLEKMAKMMKVAGFGGSTCRQICKAFKLVSPFQIFIIKDNPSINSIGVAGISKKMEDICSNDVRSIKLWEMVKYAGIPNIGEIAYKLFNNYESIDKAFEDFERGQVALVADKLGIKGADAVVMAVKVYNTLMEYKDELRFGETQFNIIKDTGRSVQIAITGGVIGYKNKGEYVDFLNRRYNGILSIRMSGMSSEVDILIADGSSESSKYRKAIRLNEAYIEKGLKNREFTTEQIGQFRDARDMHPVGECIMIAGHAEAIERLDRVAGLKN